MWYSVLAHPPKWLQKLVGPIHITNMPALSPLEEVDDDEDEQGPPPRPHFFDVEAPPSGNARSHAMRWHSSYNILHRQYIARMNSQCSALPENEPVADGAALASSSGAVGGHQHSPL